MILNYPTLRRRSVSAVARCIARHACPLAFRSLAESLTPRVGRVARCALGQHTEVGHLETVESHCL